MKKEHKRILRKFLFILVVCMASLTGGMGALPIFTKEKDKFIEEPDIELFETKRDGEKIGKEDFQLG